MMTASRALANRGVRSDFLRQIASTFLTRIGIVGVGVFSSVLIARSLGPDGRGVLAIATAVTAVAIQLGNLGLHASNTWAIARDPRLLATLLSNSVVVSLALGSVLMGIVVGLALLVPGLIPLDGPLLAVAAVGIPLGLAALLLQNLLLGLQRVRDYNVLEIGSRALGVGATLGLIGAGVVSPIAFMVAGTVVGVVILGITADRLRRLAGSIAGADLGVLRTYSAFGARAYLAALASFLVIRLDLFLVEGFLGFGAAGQYSVAVALADLVYSLPVVIGTLLFPRLARMESDAERPSDTAMVAKRVLVLMALACGTAAILAPFGIRLLYGAEFIPAVPAFVWLLPGIALLSVHTVYMNYFAAVGLPAIALVAPAVGLGANVVMNVVLLPRAGVVGAAIASTLAYGLMLVASAGLFARRARWSTPDPAIEAST
jgi:O-antigen/teichoic acid export membrane protein